MDIAEFAEGFMNVELKDWQKRHLQTLYDMGTDAKIYICMPKDSGRSHLMYIYMNAKELIGYGTKNVSK